MQAQVQSGGPASAPLGPASAPRQVQKLHARRQLLQVRGCPACENEGDAEARQVLKGRIPEAVQPFSYQAERGAIFARVSPE